MSDEAYNKKLADLQKYIPFMENMIAQLKDPKWKPREAQLNKMESLYNMITDRNKKWKYDTLLKCEEVIMKLQSKVKANKPIFPAERKEQYINSEQADKVSSTVTDIMNALKFNNARVKLNCEMSTPKSPSPIREVMPLHSPKIIPFEATNEPIRKSTNIIDPNELSVTWNCDRQDRYVNEKPDIYSSAAKSLGVALPPKVSIFDRLGPVVLPEASSDKPLLSDADLEMLRTGDDLVVVCQNEQHAQGTPKQEKSLEDINLKITPRITPVPASKPKINHSENADKGDLSKPVKNTEKTKDDKQHKHKDKEKDKSKSPKPEKIITSDIFGNCLSSIDNKILEDSKKKDKKKDETRRPSTEHKKEKHHDSKHHHESKHHHHKHKDKDKKKGDRKIEDPRVKKDKDKNKDTVSETPKEKLEVKEKPPEDKPQLPTDTQPEKPKRLADKYNPKPRKHTDTEVTEKIMNDVPSFESRDPRKRLSSLLPTPSSILGNPPFSQAIIQSLNSFPMNNTRNIPNITGPACHLPVSLQQQAATPPKPIPLMTLNLLTPQGFQSPPVPTWLNDNNTDYTRPHQVPIFEPPIKATDPRRQSLHDNSDRSMGEVRRQPKFSPPPPMSPVHTSPFSNTFVPPIFHNQQAPLLNELNFVPPIQRNIFEASNPSFQQNRFEGRLNRFDIPAPNSHSNQNNVSRKSFCPFEPLENSRDKEDDRSLFYNQNHFQGDSARRNENHPGAFRGNYNQYNNRQDNRFDRNLDRFGRKLPREMLRSGSREDIFSKERKFSPKEVKVEDSGDKQWLKSKDSDSDVSAVEQSHTKYDEIYSKLDSEKETFTSPLESLYSNPKTLVKSIQSFKIPKKPKPEPPLLPPPPVEKQKVKESNLDKNDELVQDVKLLGTEESVETLATENCTKENDKNVSKKGKPKAIVSEDTDNEDDDIPLWKRVKKRTKTIPKKQVIDDTDEEEESEDDTKEDVAEEEVQEEEPITTRRVTRQSAIKANKLITKRKIPLRSRKKVQKAKPIPKAKKLIVSKEEPEEKSEELEVTDEIEVKSDVKTEPLDTKPKEELIQIDDKDTVKNEIDSKEQIDVNIESKVVESSGLEEVKPKQEEDVLQNEQKEPNEVQKAKEELLTEAKKKNLNLNDQGAEVLQFILMNYKKIKKIFRSDSSSDDEEKERKKKKKRRDKSTSDDEKEIKEKKKHKEKHSSDDEKEVKDKKKHKEKQASEDEIEEKAKPKGEGKSDMEDVEGIKSKDKEEDLNDNETKNEEEKLPDVNADTVKTEEKTENEDPVKGKSVVEEAELKTVVKQPMRKVKKGSGPKGKVLRKKIQGRVAGQPTLVSPIKKARRSELDKLHDDIKEMLMGGEVLTSTGKRACTMPKDDSEESRKESNEDSSTVSLDQSSLVIPAKTVRVMIEKTDIEKLLTKELIKEDVSDQQECKENIAIPKLKKMVPTAKVTKKKILRKKKHRWATGFLKRKNKRKNSVSEDQIDDNDTSPLIRGKIAVHKLLPQPKIPHDKNYFIRGPKSFCKLCPFKGKLIIQHYRSAHPDDEVIISRMDATVTEHLIKEANENNYDSIVLIEVPGQRKKRYGYKCPFMCPIGTTMDFCENYYDHITSHTGEYRFFCPFCPFATSNSRNLRAHMVPQHNSNLENHGKPTTPAPPSSKYVFGYVCRQCHFVQTRRERLEKHLEVYHNNKGDIIKVNLSLICMEIEEVENRPPIISEANTLAKKILNKQDHIHESIESVVNGAGLVRAPEPSLVKDLNIFDLMKQIEADERPPVLVKIEPIEVEPDIETLIPEINIERPPIHTNQADLTVFMCKSDLPVDDELTIEQKRLKKMNEIHETVKPSRTSIVDRLQSRLDSNAQEENTFSVSTTIAPIPVVVSSSKPPPLIPLDRSKKSLDAIPKNVIPPEVVMAPKKVAPISNIINRLQDKLLPTPSTSKQASADDLEEAGSPLSSPSKESDANLVTSTLNVGPITITFNKNNEILYSCFVPFCVFNTMKAKIFEYHCKITHKDFIYDHLKCDVCQVKIEHEEDFISMVDIYKHINTCHADFLNRTAADDDTTAAANTQLESVSGNSMNAIEGSSTDVSNTIPQTDSDCGTKYPFVITSVTSVDTQAGTSTAQEAFTEFSLPHQVPNLISQAENSSGPKFPFVITSVTSLAKKPYLPPTPPKPALTLSVSLQTTATTFTTPTVLNTLATSVPIVSTFLAISPITATPIQTSPTMKPYTIASVQTAPTIMPIILNPLAPENELTSKIQLPVISCVQSLAPQKKDTIRPVPLNQLTSDNWTVQNNLTAEKRPLSLNPLPTGNIIVQSSPSPEKRSTSNVINVVSLISSDGKTLTLKDIPMTLQEKMSPRKSKAARAVLLQPENVCRFYKCPQFFCSFATDKPQELLVHLSMHRELSTTFTFCLHCDYKTSYKLYMVHLEVHHAGCDYSCGRCFYRSTNAAFVMAHSSLRHKEDPIVIQTPRENMPPKINTPKLPPLKSILKHYICGAPGCGVKTIFSNVYYDHIMNAHPDIGKVNCGICKSSLATFCIHWATHNIHPFHCRYCKVGSKSLADIVNHQATLHFKNDYCVIFRRFVPNPVYPERTALSYNVNDDDTYDRLYLIYGGNAANFSIEDDNPFEATLPAGKTSEPQQNDAESLFLNVDVSDENRNAFQGTMPDCSSDEISVNIDINASSTDEPEIPLMNTDLDEAVTDPLSLDTQDDETVNFSDDELNVDKDTETDIPNYDPKAVKHDEEYTGAMLYKCICNMRFEDRLKFRSHIVACQIENNYKCAHCGLIRKSPRTLLTHMQDHGKKRFKCSLCKYKHFTRKFVKDHMIMEHNVHETMMLPATVTKKIDYYTDEFVLRPRLAPAKKISATPPSDEVQAVNKTLFYPKDMEQLPRPPIYQTEVFCGVCNYATKVKSNMVRHLQAHQNEQEVPGTAPVNPVPCLEKSEKMFDKMVNLALSSHSGGKMGTPKAEKTEESNIPNFIPIGKRFVCGAESCNYLCPEEGMLRRHLTTFHSQELNYTCLHCNMKLFEDKLINVDVLLKHLKLHDAHLYSCGHCKFIHNLKHKVERHLVDKHSDKPSAFVVLREIVKEAGKEGVPASEKDDGKKSWKCGMCKFKCADIEEIKSHVQVKHNVNAKHKCFLCEFDSEEISSFEKHFETSHNGQTVDMIVSYYKEDEVIQKPETDPEFNTTPLWQRNKSIKHIRGILLEETNNKIAKTPGPKKPKTVKPKKIENVESKGEISTDSMSLILGSPSTSTKSGEAKKAPPKRRKSNVGSKINSSPKKNDKTGDNAKNVKDVAGDVLLISNSVETSDLINVGNIAKTKQSKNDLSTVKQNPIIISNKKLNNPSGSEVIMSGDNINPKVGNDPNQKAKILSVSYFKVDLNDTKSGASDSTHNKTEALKTPSDKTAEDVIEIIDDKIQKSQSSVKKNYSKPKPQLAIIPKENVDVIEISGEVTPPTDVTLKKIEDVKQKTQQDTEIIDISDDKVVNGPVSKKKQNVGKSSLLTVHLTSSNKASNKKKLLGPSSKTYKTVKAKTDVSLLPVTCKINLDDSSTEDSDVVEVTNESDPLTQTETTKSSECSSPADGDPTKDPLILNPDLSSPLKNIKVVSVCSLKDTVPKDVDDIEDDVDIESVEDDKTPLKKLKLDISLNEIDTMSKVDLLNGNFVGTYGPYGVPWNGNYKCPLCEKFLCISSKDFTTHMHRELQYGVYKCTACDYRDDDESAVAQHCEESHENIDEKNMVITAPDQQIVDWVAKLLVFQTRVLTLDRDEVRCYCHFCDYKCDNPSDMRKHQVRHWCIKPFTCSACKYEAVSKSALEKHAKRCHPGVDVKCTEAEIGDSVVIKRIRWNGRTEKPEDGTETYETLEMDSNLDEVTDAVLSCCYCNTRGKLDELRTHIAREHPKQEFKVYRYRCNYCASMFTSLRTLDQHFISCHSGMHRNYTEVSELVKAYQCPKCPVSDDKFATIKDHIRSHYKMIKCLYCDMTVVYWKTLRKHYRDIHSTQNFEFLYLISVEQLYERDIVRTKVVPSSYSSSINSYGNTSKKRKRLDEDVVIIENSPTRPVLQDETTNIIEEASRPKVKQVARKSTGYAKPKDNESSYGRKPNRDGFANIITTVDVMGTPVTMNIIKLAKIFDISPVVLVKDCENDL